MVVAITIRMKMGLVGSGKRVGITGRFSLAESEKGNHGPV